MASINVGAAVMNSDNIKCECGCVAFLQGVELKKLSPIVSPTGKAEIVPIPTFVCSSCGKILDLDKKEDTEKTEEKSSIII